MVTKAELVGMCGDRGRACTRCGHKVYREGVAQSRGCWLPNETNATNGDDKVREIPIKETTVKLGRSGPGTGNRQSTAGGARISGSRGRSGGGKAGTVKDPFTSSRGTSCQAAR